MSPVNVGVAYVDIKPDMAGFGRDLKTGMSRDVQKTGAGMRGSFVGIGKNMAAGMIAGFSVAAVGGFLKGAVNAASDLHEVASKSRTVFGASADAMEQWAEGGAEAFGLSKRAALDAAGGFGNMFAQLGIGQRQAAGMSRSIVELAADFASFHNASIEDVIVAQSAAFRGEYDSLQRFLPLINAATVEQKALEMTGKKTTKMLTAQEKALAVNQLMFDGAGEAAGDFARTQDSLANQVRSTEAAFENARAQLGEGLMPVMTDFIGFLNKEAIPSLSVLFGLGDEKPKEGWASGIKNLVADVQGFVMRGAASVGGAINDMTGMDAIDTAGLDFWADELHRSVGEIWEMENAGTANNAMLDDLSKYLKSSTGELGPHTGALQLDSKALEDREKATRDAASAERTLTRARRDLTDLLAAGAVDEEAVIDARERLADATKDVVRAERDLTKAQGEHDEAAAIAGILGTDTAFENLADAADNLTDAEETVADAHDRAREAAKDLREEQAGDPEFQNKLADARDRVADAQTRVNEATSKLVELSPAINTALDGIYNRLDAIGIKGLAVAPTLATLTGYETYQNMTAPTPGSPVIAPAAPAGLLGSDPLGTAGTTNNVTVNVTEPRADPVHIAREMVWSLT